MHEARDKLNAIYVWQVGIDDHRADYGVEPIRKILPIRPIHLPRACGEAGRP